MPILHEYLIKFEGMKTLQIYDVIWAQNIDEATKLLCKKWGKHVQILSIRRLD